MENKHLMPTQSVKTIRPLLAQLNNREQPDVMPIGTCRSREYFSTVDGKMSRAHGFRRFLDQTPYCNQDLHDQLLTLQIYYDETIPETEDSNLVEEYPSTKCGTVLTTRAYGNEHVTLLREIQSDFGNRYLLAGTQSRLYLLNETTGNWRILADGFGGDTNDALEIRWRVAVLKERVVVTNNVDRIQYWQIDEPTKGCNMQAFQPIDDLETILVYQAKIVVEYMGFIVLLNIYEGGNPMPGKVIWSGRDLPVVYDPMNSDLSPDSQQDQQLPNQVILNAVEFQGLLAIFTDQGIWAMNVTGNDLAPFDFSTMYRQTSGLYKCLAFPNTLVSTGEMMFWCGRDQVYSMSGSTSGPVTIEWIKNASKKLFDEINKGCCEAHVAAFNPITEEIWISYASGNSCVPSQTLVLNLRYQTAYYRPEGYTAFAMFRSDSRINFRDFLWQYCACPIASLTAEYIKEGLPCADPDCEFTPDAVYTADAFKTVYDPDTQETIITEDWDAAEASEHSLCHLLGDKKSSDFCRECNEEQIFVGAYEADKCLKDIGPSAYSLEVCNIAGQSEDRVGFTADSPVIGAASYQTFGYNSSLVLGPISLGDTTQEVTMQMVTLFIKAAATDYPCAIGLSLGVAAQPLDSNDDSCPIVWHDPEYWLLQCENEQTPEEFKANQERPSLRVNWPLLRTGLYVYLKFEIVGLDQVGDVESLKVPAVGGICDLYSLELRYQVKA
jgi:hypothetical protein